MSYFNTVSIKGADSGNIDAFGRWRTSAPQTIFSVQTQYNACPLKMESGATGTGVSPSYSTDTRMTALSATAGTGTSYTQSYKYSSYQPGKSQMIAATFVIGTAVTSAVVDVGYFDASNGIFFRQNGSSGLEFVRRTKTSGSVVDNTVSQSSWNIDPFDGTGPSGLTLDITKAQILIIDLQFLGMGRVRVGFDINGTIYLAHQFTNANVISVPYMQTGTLPIQMLLTANATGSTKTSYFKCATVMSEGGFDENQDFMFSTPEATVTAGNGTRTHLLSVRPKTTFGGITNRVTYIVESLNLNITGNASVFWELCLGVNFSVAPTYADVNTTYSSMEYGTGGTYSSLTGGIVVASGYASSVNTILAGLARSVTENYPLTLDRSGAVRSLGTLSVLVQGTTALSASRGSINFREIR